MSWDLLQYFPHEIIEVSHFRYADGSYDSRGKWTQGTVTQTDDFKIVKPQPVTGQDLQMLSQGEEASDFLFSMSRSEVKVRKNR